MKRLLVGLLWFWLGAGPVAAACSRPMRIVYWNEWSVQYRHAERVTAVERELALTQEIFRKAGCELLLRNERILTKRRHELMKSGELDVIQGASHTPEREAYAWFSLPYRDERVHLFALKELAQREQIHGFADIERLHLKLLAPTFGWYGQEYERWRPRLQRAGLLDYYDTIEQGFMMLDYGRTPLLLGIDAGIADAFLTEAGSRIVTLTPPLHVGPIALMFSRKTVTEQDVATINAAIVALEKKP